MEVSVMRHLPTPFSSSYDARPSTYQPWDNRKQYEKDQASYHSYGDSARHQPAFRYPPTPPMERQNHTKLPPISTLLAGIKDTDNERQRREASRTENTRIDPRLNGPPTPPSHPHRFEAQRPAPLRQPLSNAAPQPPKHSPSYPTPHDSRQTSTSSYSSRPSLHHHRLSSSSTASYSSIRVPSPRSAIEAPRSAYPTTMAHQRPLPEFSPRTPQTPPSAPAAVPHGDYERQWHPVQAHAHSQYAPVPQSAYAPHGPPGTQTLHLSPTSAQAQSAPPDRYVCPQCAKAFSRPSSLRIHVHSHTGEKPFVCPHAGCGKAFSVRSNMKRHQRGCHVDGRSGKDVGDDVEMDDA